MGLVDATCISRTEKLLQRAGLPVRGPRLGVDRYLELMGHDKKVEGGKIRFVLLNKIGEAFVSAAVPGEALAIVLGGEGVDDA
jgi:3-dehydroquinate synthase